MKRGHHLTKALTLMDVNAAKMQSGIFLIHRNQHISSIQSSHPTFPLDAVILLAVLVWQGVGARLRQQVLWGARDPVLTLGVLGAQGARGGHALDLSAEWALAGAHSLAHCTARHYWILLGTVSKNTHTHTHTHTNIQTHLLVITWTWPPKYCTEHAKSPILNSYKGTN